MADIEDEDNFPNDFDGLNFDNIPGLQAPAINRDTPEAFVSSSATFQGIMPPNATSPVSYTRSNSIGDIDTAFLAAVDALEARALSEMVGGKKSKNSESLRNSSVEKGDHLTDYNDSSSAKRKGKRKAELEEDIDMRTILAGYETELTCPICCDLFVGAQVANPCGHTCCGECGYGWLAQNKYQPTCAICRTTLCPGTPLLPNFAVDGFVRQHLQALARSGRPEWQERGYRTIEWNKRAESWKKQADDRAAQKKTKEAARLRRRQPRYYEVEDYPYIPPWLADGGTEDDEPLVLRAMPRRGARSNRR